MKIAITSDHAGFKMKNLVSNYLRDKKISFYDFGCDSEEPCDYPDYAHTVAKEIKNGNYDFGITFCGTGQGMNITSNRHSNIRSAVCWNSEIAKLARQHNDANVCSIPSRFITEKEVIEIVETFLNTEFEGGRHTKRVEKIEMLDPVKLTQTLHTNAMARAYNIEHNHY